MTPVLDSMPLPAAPPTSPPSAPLVLAETRPVNWPIRLWRGFLSVLDWLFGFAAILFGVAVLAVIPVLNFLSLGYLLECSGRIARTGRFRDGFAGVRKASVLGSVAICSWLILLPVRVVSGLWQDARLIDPASNVTRGWAILLGVLSVLALWHIAWACLRGGRLQHFLWPAPVRFFKWLFFQRGKYRQVRDSVLDYIEGLHLPYYFWLGARGFAGGVIWLFVPVGVLILASRVDAGVGAVLSMLGIALLFPVVLYLPFLQTHFAVTRRFKSLFELAQVRALFRRAPLAFWAALLVTLLFALPLYVLKIFGPAGDLSWFPALFFVAFIFPARLLTGWAMGRAVHRETPRHGVWRWLSRLGAIPVVFAYVVFVWFNQYVSWSGSMGMLEQHAFLVPAPLLGL